MMLIYVLILFGFLFMTKFKNCLTMDTYNAHSFLELHNVDELEETPITVQEKIENIFHENLININLLNNSVCALAKEEKVALCKAVFDTFYYKLIGIHLNKVAFHMAKLSCQENQLNYKYKNQNDDMIKQNMYPCYGRHGVIQTSFIEDGFYDMFYLSSGPTKNSITVYTSQIHDDLLNSFHIHNFVYNINMTKLKAMYITKDDILTELKLNSRIVITSDASELDKIYTREQNYFKSDPICDLEYEKKISLCKLIFKQNVYSSLRIILNFSASYLFNMNCITDSVYSKDSYSEKVLNTEQKLYPCYARIKTDHRENLLEAGDYFNTVYISRGPRKNSVFIYLRTKIESYEEKLSIFEMMENINLRKIEHTEITYLDLASESYLTYINIQKIMEHIEKEFERETMLMFTSIHVRMQIEGNRNELSIIQNLMDSIEKEYENVKIKEMMKNTETLKVVNTKESETISPDILNENNNITTYEQDKEELMKKDEEKKLENKIKISITEEISRKKIKMRVNPENISKFYFEVPQYSSFQLGPQTFKRLVDKLANKYKRMKIALRHDDKKVTQVFKTDIENPNISSIDKISQKEKLNEKIQILIRKMRLFVVEKNVKEALAEREREKINKTVSSSTSQAISTKDQSTQNIEKSTETIKKSKKKKNFKKK